MAKEIKFAHDREKKQGEGREKEAKVVWSAVINKTTTDCCLID